VLFVLATTSTSNSCIFTAEGVVVLTGTTHMNENENADLQLVAAQEVDDTGDVFLAAPTTTTANRHDRDQASWSSRPGSVLEHRHQQREKMNVNVMTKPFRLFQQEQAAQPADDSGSSGGGGGFFGSFGGGKKRGDGENNVLEGIVNSADSNGENPSTGNMAEQGQEPGGGNKIVPEEIMKSDLDEGYPTRLEAEQEANKAVLEKAATVDQSLAREDKLGHDGDNIQDVDAIVNLAGGQQGSDHVPPDATELSDGLPGEYVFTPREEPRKERGDKTQQEARGLRGLAGRLLSMFRRKPKELEDDHKNSTSTALVLRGGGEMVEQDSPRRRWWSPWGWVKRNGICQKCQQVWTLLRHTLFNPAYKGGKIKLVGYIFVVSAAILMEDMIYGFAMAMTLNAIGGMSLGVLTIAKVVELAPWIIGAYTAGSYCAARRTQLVEYVEMQITQQLRQFVTDVASQDQLTDTKDIAKADRSVLKIAELVSQDGVSAIAGTAAFAGGMMALVRGVGIGAMAVPMLAQVGVAMATFEIPILDNRVNDAYNEREEAMNELYLANLPFKETVQRAALLTNARHSKHVNALVAKAQKRVTEADNRYNRLKTVRDTIQGFFHYLAVPLTMFSLLRGKIAPKQAQSTFQGLQVLGSRAGSTMKKALLVKRKMANDEELALFLGRFGVMSKVKTREEIAQMLFRPSSVADRVGYVLKQVNVRIGDEKGGTAKWVWDETKGQSLVVPGGSIVHLTAASGKGKSTLLKLICAYLEPQQARVKKIKAAVGGEKEEDEWEYIGDRRMIWNGVPASKGLSPPRFDATDAEIETAHEAGNERVRQTLAREEQERLEIEERRKSGNYSEDSDLLRPAWERADAPKSMLQTYQHVLVVDSQLRLYGKTVGEQLLGSNPYNHTARDVKQACTDALIWHKLVDFADPAVEVRDPATNKMVKRHRVVEREGDEAVLRAPSEAMKLSDGERVRYLLCFAMLYRPRVLFLDEATKGIDAVSHVPVVQNVFAWAIRNHVTTIFTTHEQNIFGRALFDDSEYFTTGVTKGVMRSLVGISEDAAVKGKLKRELAPEMQKLVKDGKRGGRPEDLTDLYGLCVEGHESGSDKDECGGFYQYALVHD